MEYKKDGSGKKYANKQSIKNLTATNGKTITLYAQWEKKENSRIGEVVIRDVLINSDTGETYDVANSDQGRYYYSYIYPGTKYTFTQNSALVSLGATSKTPKITGTYNGKKDINITFSYYLTNDEYSYVKSNLTHAYNGSGYTTYFINTPSYYDITAIDGKGSGIKGMKIKWTRHYDATDEPLPPYELTAETSANGYAYIGYPDDSESPIVFIPAKFGYVPSSSEKDEYGNCIGKMYDGYSKSIKEPLRIYDSKNNLIASLKPKQKKVLGYGSASNWDEKDFEIKYSKKGYKISITTERNKATHALSAKQVGSYQGDDSLCAFYITIIKQ